MVALVLLHYLQDQEVALSHKEELIPSTKHRHSAEAGIVHDRLPTVVLLAATPDLPRA